ncbi:MAG: hypothetical protein ACREF4_19505, partial [Gammaproteobacteria bacterium]
GLCYPNGDHDDRVVSAARSAGYAWACTTRDGVHFAGDDRFRLRRRHIQSSHVTGASGRHSDAALAGEVWGLHAWMRGRVRGRADRTRA